MFPIEFAFEFEFELGNCDQLAIVISIEIQIPKLCCVTASASQLKTVFSINQTVSPIEMSTETHSEF